ncbi:MAG: hydrogen peroxide-inducible genes activator [Bacteroidetes bacterium]|nr:MAG: hydrogen peroxide-inducible genes activator [Bacteroidota bacterium]
MNIQQFQYVLAVAEHKHFEQAAEKCSITQSTLSTMIGKLEDELAVKLFDRKTKPVSLTKEGEELITQMQVVMKEIGALENLAQEIKGEIMGRIKIGVIPTVAPYLLPLFLTRFAAAFPKVHVVVQEMRTHDIQRALKERSIDVGIAAVPLLDKELLETSLYTEPFVLFDCHSQHKSGKQVDIQSIDFSHFLLLEEGHCLRTQVEQICELSGTQLSDSMNFEFKAGSIDSLLRFTKSYEGTTLLPYLATLGMESEDQKRLYPFAAPTPVRTIGLVVHRHFVKKRLLQGLEQIIQEAVAPLIKQEAKSKNFLPLN